MKIPATTIKEMLIQAAKHLVVLIPEIYYSIISFLLPCDKHFLKVYRRMSLRPNLTFYPRRKDENQAIRY